VRERVEFEKVAFEVTNGVLGYNNKPVLSRINLRIDRGELVGVLGASGSGKSTLLSLMAGSEVLLNGELTTTRRGTSGVRELVGFVPQLTEETWGPLCVQEVVSLGKAKAGLRTERVVKREATKWLEKLDIARLAKKRMHELSGGQRQRVAVARGLMASETLLVCDEPTSGADPVLALEIVDLLRTVASFDVAVVVATHDLSVVVPKLERVVGISKGGIVVDKKQDALRQEDISLIYGGVA
jgi:ABC-type Mn2+/Zn2+ transport system ATPase subunit